MEEAESFQIRIGFFFGRSPGSSSRRCHTNKLLCMEVRAQVYAETVGAGAMPEWQCVHLPL